MQQSTAGRGCHNNQTRRFAQKSSDVQYSVSKRPRDRITDFLFSTSRLFVLFHIVGPHWSWKCNSVAQKRQTFIKTIKIRQHVGLSRSLHHIEFSYTAPANRAADRIVCLTLIPREKPHGGIKNWFGHLLKTGYSSFAFCLRILKCENIITNRNN